MTCTIYNLALSYLWHCPAPLRGPEDVPLVLPVVPPVQQHQLAVADKQRSVVPALAVVISYTENMLLAVTFNIISDKVMSSMI